MKPIPYDEIIAKANARKEALQRYDAALHDFVHHLPQLRAAVGACDELVAAAKALDSEAAELVGWNNLATAINWLERFKAVYIDRVLLDTYRKVSPATALRQLTGEDELL